MSDVKDFPILSAHFQAVNDKRMQETETAHTSQNACRKDADTEVPQQYVWIKQEVSDEMCDEMACSEDLKNDVGSCSTNMTEMDTVPQTGMCGQDEGTHIKQEISPYTQFCGTNPYINNKEQKWESIYRDQHSHNTVSGRPSEHIRDTEINTRDVAGNFERMTENKSFTVRSRDQGLNECRESVKILDSKTMVVDIRTGEHDNLSGNEFYDSERIATSSASSEVFTGMESYNNTSTVDRHYTCQFCGVQFTDINLIKLHMQRHITENLYKYNVSGGSLTKPNDLNSHKEKPYECDICGKRFIQLGRVERHKITHTREKPFKCDVCDAGFTKNAHLNIHKRSHTGERPYKCNVCGLGFAITGNLKSHMRTHTGEKPYRCDICGLEFATTGHLKTHVRIHTGEKPFKCDVCGLEFTQTGHLSTHKKIHTGEKPYTCDVCGMAFALSVHLKTHKRTHTGEKPYKCDICGTGFTVAGNLKTHRRTHTGEKPYKCDICDGGFAQIGHLKTHRRSHTGEKPYKCDVCGTGFTDSGNLNTHKRTHTGEKPYKCDICSVKFTQIGSFNKHKRKAHGIEKP